MLHIMLALSAEAYSHVVRRPFAQKVHKNKVLWHIRAHKFLTILSEREKSADHDGESRFSVVLSVQELSALFEIQYSRIFTLKTT